MVQQYFNSFLIYIRILNSVWSLSWGRDMVKNAEQSFTAQRRLQRGRVESREINAEGGGDTDTECAGACSTRMVQMERNPP